MRVLLKNNKYLVEHLMESDYLDYDSYIKIETLKQQRRLCIREPLDKLYIYVLSLYWHFPLASSKSVSVICSLSSRFKVKKP